MKDSLTFGCCFPAGSSVLMADKTLRLIEFVKAGERVFSHDHKPVEVTNLYVTRLGPNRKMFRMKDDSIRWSSEHNFWVKRGGSQYLWSMDVEEQKAEVAAGVFQSPGMKNWDKIFVGNTDRLEYFAHVDGWRLNQPVHMPEQDGDQDLVLYLPVSPNGELIIVNGYLVGAGVDEFKTDYSKIRWIYQNRE